MTRIARAVVLDGAAAESNAALTAREYELILISRATIPTGLAFIIATVYIFTAGLPHDTTSITRTTLARPRFRITVVPMTAAPGTVCVISLFTCVSEVGLLAHLYASHIHVANQPAPAASLIHT